MLKSSHIQSAKKQYSESVKPPIWLLAFIFFLFASFALAIWAVFGDQVGGITLLALTLLLLFIRAKVIMKIQISEGELRIGAAHIDLKYLGEVEVLSVDEMRLKRGRDTDIRAFMAIRFWQPRGILVKINDPRDSTPYWLVSSKNSETFAKALRKDEL